MTAAVVLRDSKPAPGLRRLRRWRDMGGVASLISRSFPRGVDRTGRRMLAEMSALGRAGFLGWFIAPLIIPSAAYAEGFVWEEGGSIIGNASLSEVESASGRFVLSNVAVDPDHRRRGIGRALVEATVDLARQRGATLLLLQVEPENFPAVHLYSDLGFQSLTTRRLWTLRPLPRPPDPRSERETRPRLPTEWGLQWALAQRLHPEGLLWPHPLQDGLFRRNAGFGRIGPGSAGHWAWPAEGRPQGWVTARRTGDVGDWRLVLLVEPDGRGKGEGPLLRRAVAELEGRARRIVVELPAGTGEEELTALGFIAERTLSWMAKDWPGPSARDGGRLVAQS
jgi:GNAT superfamily N-acetyltransferase